MTWIIIIFIIIVIIKVICVRSGVKNPRHGNFPLGGFPPPGPPRTRFFRKVSGKKLTERGGTPPPPWKVSVSGVFEPFPSPLHDDIDHDYVNDHFFFIGQMGMGTHTLSGTQENINLQQRRDYM